MKEKGNAKPKRTGPRENPSTKSVSTSPPPRKKSPRRSSQESPNLKVIGIT